MAAGGSFVSLDDHQLVRALIPDGVDGVVAREWFIQHQEHQDRALFGKDSWMYYENALRIVP